jgi:hypothetical protein
VKSLVKPFEGELLKLSPIRTYNLGIGRQHQLNNLKQAVIQYILNNERITDKLAKAVAGAKGRIEVE